VPRHPQPWPGSDRSHGSGHHTAQAQDRARYLCVHEQLDDEEYFVLDYAEDEFGAFALLAWLGSERHQPARAAAAVERLLERGLVSIEESYDFNPDQPRTLGREEALAAIRDPRKWRDWRVEPVEPAERHYSVVMTERGRAAWEAAQPRGG
jgi:hypothetical protein